MCVVNGKPAVVFNNDSSNSLQYARAADVDGTAWSTPVTVDGTARSGESCSLAVVNGKPAIGYLSGFSYDLKYARALDSAGESAAAWVPPSTVDSAGDVGMSNVLLEVDGRPALVYHNSTRGSLQYLRATSGGPNILWPPDFRVEQPADSYVAPGDTKSFGVVAVGTSAPLTFTLRNPNDGSVVLDGLALTLEGPDAAEFVAAPLPPSLPAGSLTEFTVHYAPVSPGRKSAVLTIAARTVEGPLAPYRITLTGNSVPDLQVEQVPGGALTDDQTLTFPVIATRTNLDFSFVVRNPGGADLNGLSLTVTGDGAADFPVIAPPAPVVPPGGSTTFVLRHFPLTGGSKTATLHLASNVGGSRSPFDIHFKMLSGLPDQNFRPAADPAFLTAIQPDGRILAARSELSRYLPNGNRDTSFFSPAVNLPAGEITCLAVQKNGNILIGGSFSGFDGFTRRGLVRLLPDGSVDPAFDAAITAGTVYALAVQPDGKILAAGDPVFAAGNPPSHVVRFHADGSFDSTFHASLSQLMLATAIALQPDGRIIVGTLAVTDGVLSGSLVRLHPDGAPDSFAAPAFTAPRRIAVQPDGRILVAAMEKTARLFPDGTQDFVMPAGSFQLVQDLVLQAGGDYLVAGSFDTLGGIPRQNVARIKSNGTLDAAFNPNVAGGGVDSMAVQADGRVVLAGTFTEAGGVPQQNLARLQNDSATNVLETAGPSTVRWRRDGGAPEVSDVTFDLKPSGASDWTRLGSATRIAGGWQLSGLTLPSSGTLRAQGYASRSVMETVAPIRTAIEYWRIGHFQTPDNTGSAADGADPDHDGLTNFTEFAFGLSPVDRASNSLPEFKHSGASFTVSFTPPEGREDVIYGAEWSPTMRPGSWTELTDTGAGSTHQFSVSGGGTSVFVRFLVRMR
jgi:uncharacterized delta-60 repeat protein